MPSRARRETANSIVLIYGLLASLMAVPLDIVGSWGLSVPILSDLKIQPGDFAISLLAIKAHIAVALLAPCVASLLLMTADR